MVGRRCASFFRRRFSGTGGTAHVAFLLLLSCCFSEYWSTEKLTGGQKRTPSNVRALPRGTGSRMAVRKLAGSGEVGVQDVDRAREGHHCCLAVVLGCFILVVPRGNISDV
jgi:hypothetical protein